MQGGVCAIGVLLVCWEKRAGNWRRTYRHHSPGCLPLGHLCDLFYIVVGGYAIVCIGDGGQHSFVSFSRASLAISPRVTFIGVLYQFSSASVPRRFSSSLRIVSARARASGREKRGQRIGEMSIIPPHRLDTRGSGSQSQGLRPGWGILLRNCAGVRPTTDLKVREKWNSSQKSNRSAISLLVTRSAAIRAHALSTRFVS